MSKLRITAAVEKAVEALEAERSGQAKAWARAWEQWSPEEQRAGAVALVALVEGEAELGPTAHLVLGQLGPWVKVAGAENTALGLSYRWGVEAELRALGHFPLVVEEQEPLGLSPEALAFGIDPAAIRRALAAGEL